MDTEKQKELQKKETLKAIEKLCLLDDNLMTLVFDRNIEATQILLNVILQRDDLKVLEVIGQREYKNSMSDGRSITIDIYAVDGNSKVYDIEVQRASAGADAHRARFHSSMIDTRMLKARQEFNEIHDSYVIFITASDVIGAGHPLYHVDRMIKETEGGLEIMCQIFEDLAEERVLDEKVKLIKNLMETMRLTAEQAMEAMKISETDKKLLVPKL